ncbi:NEL-type E3 ubiquitin ligase domain-containing protein [Pseudomonas sp. SDO528_S397]
MPDLLPPAATQSLHGPFLEQAIPAWLTDATPQRRDALKASSAPVFPGWYKNASVAARKKMDEAALASFTAQTALDKRVADLQSIDAFAEPLLVAALKSQFNVQLDVNKTLLCLRKPVDAGVFNITLGSFEVLRLPLLQAALHNFEASEAQSDTFHPSSGFLAQTGPGSFEPVSTTLTVTQFTGLCRTLDIGAQYQTYLKAYLYPSDLGREHSLHYTFVDAAKTALRAAAEQALLKQDIEPGDYRMILSVIAGEVHPTLGGRPVWFRDLGLMKHRLTGCVIFYICEKYRFSNDVILYIPNEPQQPLKRYTFEQMRAMFKARLTARDPKTPFDGSPSDYQRFFSQFVAYEDRPDYFSQFTDDAPGVSATQVLAPYVDLLNKFFNGINPFAVFTGINQLPPPAPRPQAINPDPYLAPTALARKGHGTWAANIDLWNYLFDRHREQMLADARSHAVPSADVDARVRSQKFAQLLNIGMLVLGIVGAMVPVLGEVMLGVMAAQLLSEVFTGVVEWSEGDHKAAKQHLIDVAENLALMALMAGAGKGLARLVAVEPAPVIEAMSPVTMPDGQVRLSQPTLKGYESPAVLAGRTDSRGLHDVNGSTYLRQQDQVYQTAYDASLKRWRIRHPSDPEAWQPPLAHNGQGAWRHVLERPRTWDRLTLLRRMGPVTQALSDEQLLKVADISGISDDALRQMHLNNTAPPAELADSLRLFEAERGVAQVIEQAEGGRAVDEHYLFVPSLIADLPRWPAGRALEVFDGPGLGGKVIRYGAERIGNGVKAAPPIQLTRADVLGEHFPAKVLAALDEREVVQLLGGEPARLLEQRPAEFSRQIAEHARTRQPALFESLYEGKAQKNPLVAKLQRLYPGLDECAAQAVLTDANVEQVNRLHSTGRVPLALDEHARWRVKQGRLRHAYAGLHMENLASASSRRLALHTLSRLPGWSDSVRLEVRDAHIDGPLLDAVGDANARVRKYLVKQGPFFQAANERGEMLNSVPRHGDNFYASIMHALPDEARTVLGFPEVGQSPMLRQAIIDHAGEDRLVSAGIVDGAVRRQPWFRPPQRVSQTLLGYPASGRGQGVSPQLVSRVQDVYDLSEGQANGFILRHMLQNRSDAQIFTLLNNRLREWQTLEATLDQWVAEDVARPAQGLNWAFTSRSAVAASIKRSWRQSPLAALPRYAELDLFCNDPLPELEADFSHVRSLTVGGRGLTDAGIESLLQRFPQVEQLTIAASNPLLRTVPQALGNLRQLKRLNVLASQPLEAAQVARLSELTQLEQLKLDGVLAPNAVMDFSRLTRLRSLTVSGHQPTVFPDSVLELPDLQRLDLKNAIISKLPAKLFEAGRERLWSGLSLDWSHFSAEDFKAAYDYVRSRPQHVMDQEEMVSTYCQGHFRRWRRLMTESGERTGFGGFPDPLGRAFFRRWLDADTRLQAIEGMVAQFDQISGQLNAWKTIDVFAPEFDPRWRASQKILASWYDGVQLQLGIEAPTTLLDLSPWTFTRLPGLPADSFAHVRSLKLKGVHAPAGQVQAFVEAFPALRTLALSDCALTELPLAATQRAALEHLDLSANPLTALDVGTLPKLQALNLRGTTLQAYPIGAENLAELVWLDLRDTQVSSVPAAALVRNELLIGTHLQGAPLTAQSQVALSVARRWVEQAKGLPVGALDRLAAQAVPEGFAPRQEDLSISQQLLPVPAPQPPRWAEQLRGEGLTEPQVQARIASLDDLTRRLNGWLLVRESRGAGWSVSAQARSEAARRIVAAWQGLDTLDLDGLQLGDLPEPQLTFDHVHSLNLNGVRLTEQGSNAFLSAFPRLRTLVLNGNALEALPEAINGMADLERLELAGNNVTDPERLYPTLEDLPRLDWLDLSHNDLDTFSVERLPRLRTLDLGSNRLEDWPQGALQSPALRSLNLRNNNIAAIPLDALDGQHEALLAGVDLSDNVELSRDSLERLQGYIEDHERQSALGITLNDIEQTLDQGNAPAEAMPPDENVPDTQPDDERVDAWLGAAPPGLQAERRALWARLAAEPDNGAFFHLLERLQDTEEYRLARADLTRRVWAVATAAGTDSELRGTLFAMSNTHGTCVDGRILTFSGLEVRVYAYNALRDIEPTLASKRTALLSLARRLFRLDKVEALAKGEERAGMDAAEISLEYRIGLRDVLDLPGQPTYMRYGTPVRGGVLAHAVERVRAAEASDELYEYLINQDYWVSYLEERYPEDFEVLRQQASARHEQFEAEHPVIDQAYHEATTMLDIELQTERNLRLIALSRQETAVPQNRK